MYSAHLSFIPTSETLPIPTRITQQLTPRLFGGSEQEQKRFWEFFTANIRNRNTRQSYLTAVYRFADWCEIKGLDLANVEPMIVAAYIEQLSQQCSPATVKQHLAAIRMLFDWLVVGQIVPFNPASSVRGPKHVVKVGKTPILSADEARELLSSMDTSTVIGLRDRALIGVMVYSFARISAAVGMKVGDYYIQGKRSWFRLYEKGGKFKRIPAHHLAQTYMDEYLMAAGIEDDRKGPLFRVAYSRNGQRLLPKAMTRGTALQMVKRRALAIGLPSDICNHTFRGTGITDYLRNGGSLEKAAIIADHESTRTTQLYDRRSEELSLDEIERIHI